VHPCGAARVHPADEKLTLTVDECFYEKVIKVKADVAALLCLISVFLCVWHVSSTVPLFLGFFSFLVLGGLSPHFHRKFGVRIAQER
jgi:F0F1-type ATP synthase assembly protein I